VRIFHHLILQLDQCPFGIVAHLVATVLGVPGRSSVVVKDDVGPCAAAPRFRTADPQWSTIRALSGRHHNAPSLFRNPRGLQRWAYFPSQSLRTLNRLDPRRIGQHFFPEVSVSGIGGRDLVLIEQSSHGEWGPESFLDAGLARIIFIVTFG